MTKLIIYMDVCCLNRPFDDQSQILIQLESSAILSILGKSGGQEIVFIGSDAIDVEIENIPDHIRYQQILEITKDLYSNHIVYTTDVIQRAKFLVELGFSKMDALHVASAETAKADVLLTTDSKFIKVAKRNGSVIKVLVENPINWLERKEENNENC